MGCCENKEGQRKLEANSQQIWGEHQVKFTSNFLLVKIIGYPYVRKQIFNDFDLFKQNKDISIWRITVYYSTQYDSKGYEFYGFEVTYFIDKIKYVSSGFHGFMQFTSLQKLELILEENEYINEVYGHYTEYIQRLGFKTSKNRMIETGKRIGCKFSHVVSINQEIAGFGGGVDDKLGYLEVFKRDLPIILSRDKIQEKYQLNVILPTQLTLRIFKLALSYLDIQSITNIFQICRQTSLLRYDASVLNQLGCYIINQCNNNQRHYLGKLLKLEENQYNTNLKLLQRLWQCTRNMVLDPYGLKKFAGWKITQDNNENKNSKNNWILAKKYSQYLRTCNFVATGQKCCMELQIDLRKNGNNILQQKLQNGQVKLKIGCWVAYTPGTISEGSFTVYIQNKKRDIIFTKSSNLSSNNVQQAFPEKLNDFWQKVQIEYRQSKTQNNQLQVDIAKVIVKIEGSVKNIIGRQNTQEDDEQEGLRFSGVYVRAIPVGSTLEEIKENFFEEITKMQ